MGKFQKLKSVVHSVHGNIVVCCFVKLKVLNYCFILTLNGKEISKNLIFCQVIEKLFNKMSDNLFEKLAVRNVSPTWYIKTSFDLTFFFIKLTTFEQP